MDFFARPLAWHGRIAMNLGFLFEYGFLAYRIASSARLTWLVIPAVMIAIQLISLFSEADPEERMRGTSILEIFSYGAAFLGLALVYQAGLSGPISLLLVSGLALIWGGF